MTSKPKKSAKTVRSAHSDSARDGMSSRSRWVVTGLTLLIVLLLPYAIGGADREDAFSIDPARMSMTRTPAWLESGVEDSLARAFARMPSVSLREDDELETLVAQMGLSTSSGWIESVRRVRKKYPNSMEVHLDLRQPIARLETFVGEFLVDASGVVIAPSSEAPELIAERRLPLIHDPLADTPARRFRPEVGVAVADPILKQGILVAAEIEPHREQFEKLGVFVAVIDLTPLSTRRPNAISDVDLIAANGLRLEWGRPAGPAEPVVATKVSNLRQAAQKVPNFRGVQVVRLQFKSGFVVGEPGPGGVGTVTIDPARTDAYKRDG